jgi:hypothetical protein
MPQANSTQIKPFDEMTGLLNEVGIDYSEEMLELNGRVTGNLLPRIRIEHQNNGKHKLYADLGEAYLDEPQDYLFKGNKLEAIVICSQGIRALWAEGEVIPTCSAVNSRPTVESPISESCAICPEAIIGSGKCKPKVRLLILTEIDGMLQPAIFALPPTSIKHWNNHLKKLLRSNLPAVAMKTVFSLSDVKKNGYRWGEININIKGLATKNELLIAKSIRDDHNNTLKDVQATDFSDPGDKLTEL